MAKPSSFPPLEDTTTRLRKRLDEHARFEGKRIDRPLAAGELAPVVRQANEAREGAEEKHRAAEELLRASASIRRTIAADRFHGARQETLDAADMLIEAFEFYLKASISKPDARRAMNDAIDRLNKLQRGEE